MPGKDESKEERAPEQHVRGDQRHTVGAQWPHLTQHCEKHGAQAADDRQTARQLLEEEPPGATAEFRGHRRPAEQLANLLGKTVCPPFKSAHAQDQRHCRECEIERTGHEPRVRHQEKRSAQRGVVHAWNRAAEYPRESDRPGCVRPPWCSCARDPGGYSKQQEGEPGRDQRRRDERRVIPGNQQNDASRHGGHHRCRQLEFPAVEHQDA